MRGRFFAGESLGQGEVGGDLEAVGGFVVEGFALGERGARQLLADAVLQDERLVFAVPEIGLAGLGVAVRR